jgi:hypothetical protein
VVALNVIATVATATSSPHTQPCQTCTAHAPGFGEFVVIAILVIGALIYLVGRSDGKQKVYGDVDKALTGKRKGRK